MTPAAQAEALAGRIDELLGVRSEANERYFRAQAEPLARLCHAMAERFARGGRLVALGLSPAARTDVRHVTVEFVHPVIVGKRALPAIGLSREGGPLEAQIELIAEPDDIAIAFGADEDGGQEVRAGVAAARERGCLTLAFSPAGAEWELVPEADDAFVRQELCETAYHVLWELVHVFFDHRGLLSGREQRPTHDTGHSSFLYPFLSESESELEPVVEDVRSSALLKATEVSELRAQTLGEGRDQLIAAADTLRTCFEGGGKLLALGNGGSATDAMDLVADLRYPPAGQRLAAEAGDRPDRGHRDHHRGRQRHRHRGNLPAPGDRLRPPRRRPHRPLDQRQLGEHGRGAGRGSPARARHGGDGRLRRRAGRR